MNEKLTASETTSKNVFEKYLQLIERLRFKTELGITQDDLDFLESLILLTERILQEKSMYSFINAQIDELNTRTNEFLLELYDLVEFNSNDFLAKIIPVSETFYVVSYNIMAAITLISNITPCNFENSLRHLIRLFPSRKTVKIINDIKEEITFNNTFGSKVVRYVILTNYDNNGSFNLKFTDNIEDNEKAYYTDYFENIMRTMVDNLLFIVTRDYFSFGDINIYKSLTIDILAKKLSTFDLHNTIESLFYLNQEDLYFEWSVKVVFTKEDEIYNAKNISHLIYSLSFALESIGDIEVEIENWGTGSRWINLKLKIKDDVSKFDLKDIMNKVRQQLEGLYTGKTYGEVMKFEEEALKIQAEAAKIRKEVENMPDASISAQKNELDLIAQKIELEKKYLELMEKREDIISKKISNVLKASELITNGIISNDGKIQLYINDCLFININDHVLDSNGLKTIDEIEAKEDIRK